MIWLVILALAAGTFGLRCAGPALAARLPPWLERVLRLLPAAMLAAILVQLTLGGGPGLTARAVGLGAGAGALWLRAPLPVVLLLAMLTAGLLRAGGLP